MKLRLLLADLFDRESDLLDFERMMADKYAARLRCGCRPCLVSFVPWQIWAEWRERRPAVPSVVGLVNSRITERY